MATYSKEWNGTLIEVSNRLDRTELIIDGRTVDFVEGINLVEGKNDYMHGYDGENHIEVRFRKATFLIFSRIKLEFYYNGRKIYVCNI